MLEIISNDVIVLTDEPIPLEMFETIQECGVKLQGESELVFYGMGIYMLNLCAVATPSAATVGTVGIQIVNDGTLQGIAAVEDVTEITSVHALSLVHLVKAPALIAFRNVGCDAIFDIDVIVTRII